MIMGKEQRLDCCPLQSTGLTGILCNWQGVQGQATPDGLLWWRRKASYMFPGIHIYSKGIKIKNKNKKSEGWRQLRG